MTLFTEADIIHSYTRADMLSDGSLIDVTDMASERGFKIPVALTRAAYEDAVAWTDADNDRQGTLQDQAGRLWDVLVMAFFAAARAGENPVIRFTVHRIARGGRAQTPRPTVLVSRIGPGDEGEPVITIARPGEHD